MAAELARKKAGKRTRTKMSAAQLAEYVHTTGDLPERVKAK